MIALKNFILVFIAILVTLSAILICTVVWAGVQFLRVSNRNSYFDFKNKFYQDSNFASNLIYTQDKYCDCKDSLYNVDYGGKIPSLDKFDVFFRYNSSDTRKCIVSLVNSTNNISFANATVYLTAGPDQNISVTLNRYDSVSEGTGYNLLIQLFDSANVQTAYFKQAVTVEVGKQGFYISEGKIYDANMNEFIMRGINNGHLWFDRWNKWRSYKALDNIAITGSNVVRIAWNMNLTGGLVQNDLNKIVSSAISNKLVPIVTVMDSTAPASCNKDSACLLKIAEWWASRMPLLIKYRKYIIVNIANEWAGTSAEMWRDSYKPVITTIRNAGFSGLLMIDSSTNQDPNGPILYGNNLIEFDSAKNLAFSVHTYGRWSVERGEFDIKKVFQTIKTAKIPFVIGEFGMNIIQTWNGVTRNLTVDVHTLMSECQTLGFGYLGWQWAGDHFTIALDNNFEAVNRYSLPWGEALINSPVYGIKASSKLATVF